MYFICYGLEQDQGLSLKHFKNKPQPKALGALEVWKKASVPNALVRYEEDLNFKHSNF